MKKNIIRFQSGIYRLIDWFIHSSIKDAGPEAFRQARLEIVFSGVLIVTAVTHAALFYLLGGKIASVIVCCALFIGICNLFFLRHTGRFFLAGIFLTTILLVTLCSINFFWGGWRSPGLMWLAVVPVIGTNLSGRRAGYIWVIITLLCVFIFCLLDWYGFIFSSELNSGNLRIIQLLMLVAVISIISIFIFLYEAFKDYMVYIHKKAEMEIKDLNRRLEESVFDRTEKLKIAQEEIVQKEHKSELADITTGTLHNVKNILNSVKISSEVLHKIYSEGSVQGLRKASHLLEENKDNIEEFILNNPKGKKLIEYYLKIGELYDKEEVESIKHLKRLQEKVNAIEYIVTAQQGYAGRSEVEDVSIEDLIEDALVMYEDSFEAHQIKVVKEFFDTPRVMAIKTKLMHVFINLLKNAKEAMKDTPMEARKLVLKTGQTGDSVYVQVKDTGCGIIEENKKNMFQHGFTTKDDGRGFGLHSCLAYMKEMGGDISVESQGQGKGTTFVLNFSDKHHPLQGVSKRMSQSKPVQFTS